VGAPALVPGHAAEATPLEQVREEQERQHDHDEALSKSWSW